MDVTNQEDNEFEGETIIERMAKLAGELSGDHDTSNEIEEIKQNLGYTDKEENEEGTTL